MLQEYVIFLDSFPTRAGYKCLMSFLSFLSSSRGMSALGSEQLRASIHNWIQARREVPPYE